MNGLFEIPLFRKQRYKKVLSFVLSFRGDNLDPLFCTTHHDPSSLRPSHNRLSSQA